MTDTSRLVAAPALAVAGLLAAVGPAPATSAGPWMSEAAMRAAFIGKTLNGHYASGTTWTETYLADGRLDYREAGRQAVGKWHFHSHVFCTFYDPPLLHPPLNGGCWTAVRTSANCYEFYLAGLTPNPPFRDDASGATGRWNARGWRTNEPSTCGEKPSV